MRMNRERTEEEKTSNLEKNENEYLITIEFGDMCKYKRKLGSSVIKLKLKTYKFFEACWAVGSLRRTELFREKIKKIII